MTGTIRELLDAFNRQADAIAVRLRMTKNTDATGLAEVGDARRLLNEQAKAAGFIRLFDGRFRLSGKQVVEAERQT